MKTINILFLAGTTLIVYGCQNHAINNYSDTHQKTGDVIYELENAPPIKFTSISVNYEEARKSFEQSRQEMESSLKDPFSVMYRNVKAIKVVFPGYDKEFFYFCGEINAKNSYGGYAGFKPFFSQGGKI